MGGFKYLLFRLEKTIDQEMRFDVACGEALHHLLQSVLPIRAVFHSESDAGSDLVMVTYHVRDDIAHEIYEQVKIVASGYFDDFGCSRWELVACAPAV